MKTNEIDKIVEVKSLRAGDCLPDEDVVNASQVVDMLTTLTAKHEEEKASMVREIIAKAQLVKNPIETATGTIDGSFYQIYRGNVELVAKQHGVDLSKTDVTTN
jgi:lipid II:glycine glycyltransferase (peptidoglycan interpeptide bridge formation enzyme)